MVKSKNIEVQKLLDDWESVDLEKYQIVEALRKVVFEIVPTVSERVIYGGVMFALAGDFGGVFVSKNHVSFEFSRGFEFEDPQKVLEGSGKYRRHLKFRSIDDVAKKDPCFLVKQAVA